MERDHDAAPERCRNCELPVSGNFCSACGQRNIDHRRPLVALLRELFTELLELDGRLRRTLVPFLVRPGFLSREFREGRRVRFTSPLRLYIATSLLCFSMIALDDCITPADPDELVVRFDPGDALDSPRDAGEARIADRLRAFERLSAEEQRHRLVAGLTSHMPKALLLLVPVFAGILALLTMRRRYLYVDHLVFALHVHSFWFLVLALGVFLSDWISPLPELVMAIYALVAFKRFYELGWGGALWRAAIGSLLYAIVLAAAFAAVLIATLLLG